MRRLLRWAFNFAAVVSAVLLAGVCVLRVRSHWRTDWMVRNQGQATEYIIASGSGSVIALSGHMDRATHQFFVNDAKPLFFVPYFAPALLTLVPPACWLVARRLARRRHRQARGLCPSCGYDLRATPGRCPECGAVWEAKVRIAPQKPRRSKGFSDAACRKN